MATRASLDVLLVMLLILACALGKPGYRKPGYHNLDPLELEFDLSGKPGDWKVVNTNGSVSVNATVPGTIYTDLMHAGILADPYYGFNDVLYRWVALDNWTYRRTFNVSANFFAHGAIMLDCHGIDTVAHVFVNKKLVYSTQIMFHRYGTDVKDALKEGLNTLTVAFTSPITYSIRRAASYGYHVPPKCPPKVQNGECYVNFLRKEQSSFSWDWGPAFPTMGIWKPLYLRAYDTISINEFTAVTKKDEHGHWHVNGTIFFNVSPEEEYAITTVTAYFSIPSLLYRKVVANISSSQTSLFYDITVNGPVSLWWPHTHGTPTLYNLTLAIRTQSGREELNRTIGFRTIELVQDPIPGAPGLTFYFRVNGHAIFMKGSNWIPADSFHERISDVYLYRLLTSAREANLNMLRVWGGGIYAADFFYKTADELGILIWQDLMFACSLYPTDAAFITETEAEVTQQVRRLMSHPSIAIWAGNNENEAGLAANWYNTSSHYKLYYNDYIKLYIDTLRPIVIREDPSRPFIASSPTNGAESERQGWVAKDPYSTHFGDLHFYDYTNDSWSLQTYPVPRFMSEYGVQAWCSLTALRNVSQPSDLVMNSSFYAHRQHRMDSNTVMEKSVARHLPLPKTNSPQEYFKHFIYLSQIDQAVAIQTESELMRRSQSSVTTNGSGITMGALYWQLNDIWQAPTWASIEYGGKWKMLHYFVKRFFARTILSPYVNGTRLVVYYIQDPLPDPLKLNKHNHNVDATSESDVLKFKPGMRKNERPPPDQVFLMKCYSYSSMKPLKIWAVPFTKPKVAAAKVYEVDLTTALRDAGCATRSECFFHFSLHSDTSAPDTVLLPTYPKDAVGVQPSDIQVSFIRPLAGASNLLEVSLKAKNIAAYVWLDSGIIEGQFSDNSFFMVTPTHTVTFASWDGEVSASKLQQHLTVTSLADVFL